MPPSPTGAPPFYPGIHALPDSVLGSASETGWDSLAPRAATTEWRGGGTHAALIVVARLD